MTPTYLHLDEGHACLVSFSAEGLKLNCPEAVPDELNPHALHEERRRRGRGQNSLAPVVGQLVVIMTICSSYANPR